LPIGTSLSARVTILCRRSVPPFPGPSIISIEMPRCRQPLACMNHITSFGIEPARADQHRQAYTLAAAYHFRAARLLNMHGPASAGQLAG